MVASDHREAGDVFAQTQIADLCELQFAFNALQRQWLPVVDDAGRSANPAIYLAGEYTDQQFPATLEAAVRSGRTAAEQLARDLRN